MTFDASTAIVPQVSTDDHLIALWLAQKPERTAVEYRSDLARFRSYCSTPLRSLTLGELQGFAAHLEASGLSAATRARCLSVIRGLLRMGHRLGYLLFDVGGLVRIPRVPDRRHARVLSEQQVFSLLAAAATLRDRALLTLLYSSGVRVSELVALRWADLVERGDAGHLHVLSGKGGESRSILLSSATWSLLEEYRRSPLSTTGAADPAFPGPSGRPLTTRAVRLIVDGAATRAGLPSVSPHWLRHACASHALDRGCPLHVVRETLGHRSLSTTSVYVTARPNDSASRYLAV